MKIIEKEVTLTMELPVEVTLKVSYYKGKERDFSVDEIVSIEDDCLDASDVEINMSDNETELVIEQIQSQ